MAAKPKTIDEYFASVPADKRPALERIRTVIRKLAPEAEEYLSYGIMAFRLHGKPLVGLGFGKDHCALYPMNSTTVAAHKELLEGYELSKGTIRFLPSKPMSATLMRKLLKSRIAECEAATGQEKKLGPVTARSIDKTKPTKSQMDAAVISFLRELDHPLKAEFEKVRTIVLGASPEIREGIKWNAPSFRTSENFATLNLRSLEQVQLIFHRGAKVKMLPKGGLKIADPAGLIKWLAPDRALVTVGAGKELVANKSALRAVVQEWIQQL